jgi:7,8-dihydroneopterin aldolase/epimerase/oxygenase
MGIIRIEGMEFFAYHGCFKEEQVIGTRFIADVTIETDTSQAEITDDLKQTINYQAVYKLVKTEMEQKSHLLEHVARRILDSIFIHYTDVQHVTLKIAKLNPALSAGGRVKEVSVTLYR